jgi:hypothetical protein
MQFAGRLDGSQIDLVLEKPALELADAFVLVSHTQRL